MYTFSLFFWYAILTETDTPGGVSLREKLTPQEGCPYEGGILWNCPKETPTASGDLITAKMVRISSPSAPKTGREFCQRS